MSKRPWFINLTPHPVVLYAGDEEIFLKPAAYPARVNVKQEGLTQTRGLPVMHNTYGEISNLPEPQKGLVFVVSLIVRQALGLSRPDVVAPDTGSSAVRSNGCIRGVTQLVGACS